MIILLLAALLGTSAQAQQFGGKSGVGGKFGVGGGPVAATAHTFTHAQTTAYSDGGGVAGVTTTTATLGSTPDTTKAHVLVATVGSFLSTGFKSVVDGNSNTYSQNPSGCATKNDADGIGTSCLYFLIVPVGGNASSAVTANLIDNASNALWLYVDDYTCGTTIPSFDMDAIATVLNAAAGNTSLPSLIPVSSGELLVAGGATSDGFTGVGGSWTQNDHGTGFGGVDAAYILSSASGATTVSFADPNIFSYNTVGMAFK